MNWAFNKISDDAAAQELLDGNIDFSYNLVHNNVPSDAFTVDFTSVSLIDPTVVAAYAMAHNNTSFDTPSLIGLTNPFDFADPGLLPATGSPALTGANFAGPDFNGFFTKVPYRGAFGTDNWMKGWASFYPVTINY